MKDLRRIAIANHQALRCLSKWVLLVSMTAAAGASPARDLIVSANDGKFLRVEGSVAGDLGFSELGAFYYS